MNFPCAFWESHLCIGRTIAEGSSPSEVCLYASIGAACVKSGGRLHDFPALRRLRVKPRNSKHVLGEYAIQTFSLVFCRGTTYDSQYSVRSGRGSTQQKAAHQTRSPTTEQPCCQDQRDTTCESRNSAGPPPARIPPAHPTPGHN